MGKCPVSMDRMNGDGTRLGVVPRCTVAAYSVLSFPRSCTGE